MAMKRIAIIGAGQSGLQLGLGLLAAGYEVTILSDRSADDVRQGRVLSSQCMFDTALQTERDLKRIFPESEWNKLHLRIIYYGREHCTARGCDGKTCPICAELVSLSATK